DIVRKLMIHMDKAEGSHYRDELLSKIIDICSQNDYQHITNFEWYISILVELTRLEGTKHGSLISLQMLDVAVRVESIRQFACNQMAILLENAHMFIVGSNSTSVAEVLYAAAWICGEFCSHLKEPEKTLNSMLNTKIIQFPGHIQSVYFQNILKIITYILTQTAQEEKNKTDDIKELLTSTIDKLSAFLMSGDVEAQERASTVLHLLKTALKLIERNEFNSSELSALFEGILNPVAPKAQRKVAIPQGLDLDAWINDPPSESEDETELASSSQNANQLFYGHEESHGAGGDSYYHGSNLTSSGTDGVHRKSKYYEEPSAEVLEKQRADRKQSEKLNPFYLKDISKSSLLTQQSNTQVLNGSQIPFPAGSGHSSTLPISLALSSSDQYYRQSKIDEENRRLKKKMKTKSTSQDSTDIVSDVKGKKSRKSKKQSKHTTDTTTNVNNENENDDDFYPKFQVKRGGELPEGAQENEEDIEDDENNKNMKKNDPHRALNINLEDIIKPKQQQVSVVQDTAPPVLQSSLSQTKESHKKKTKDKRKSPKDVDTKPTIPTSKQRTRSDYNELLSPNNDDNHQKSPVTTQNESTTVKKKSSKKGETKNELKPSVNNTEEKSSKKKKKKTTEVTPVDNNNINTETQLFDIMNDDQFNTEQTSINNTVADDYKLAAQSSNIRVEYSISPTSTNNHLNVKFLLKNLTSSIINSCELKIIDSLSSKLILSSQIYDQKTKSLKFPSVTLFPYSKNYLHIEFLITQISFAQKLATTFTCSVQKSNDNIETDKLEFKLDLPCSQYLKNTSIDSVAFADLLSNTGSSSLTSKYSMKVTTSHDLNSLTNYLCQMYRFTVVDKIGNATSLYSESILGHPVALLLKQTDSQTTSINVDGKSSESHFLSNLMEEIKQLIEQK
ncbi:unnamed protein product, partial [Didymodactylos carnosus]